MGFKKKKLRKHPYPSSSAHDSHDRAESPYGVDKIQAMDFNPLKIFSIILSYWADWAFLKKNYFVCLSQAQSLVTSLAMCP